MKLDYDFVKQLLTAYEQSPIDGLGEEDLFNFGEAHGKNRRIVLDTVYSLSIAELVTTKVDTPGGVPLYIDKKNGRITPKGSKVLDSLQNNKIQKLIKSGKPLGRTIVDATISGIIQALF